LYPVLPASRSVSEGLEALRLAGNTGYKSVAASGR